MKEYWVHTDEYDEFFYNCDDNTIPSREAEESLPEGSCRCYHCLELCSDEHPCYCCRTKEPWTY